MFLLGTILAAGCTAIFYYFPQKWLMTPIAAMWPLFIFAMTLGAQAALYQWLVLALLWILNGLTYWCVSRGLAKLWARNRRTCIIVGVAVVALDIIAASMWLWVP